MGETEEIRGEEAEFREHFRPWPVIIGGGSGHRRPGPPGASPEEEARHEAHVPYVQTPLFVRPEDRDRFDQRPREAEVLAPPGVPVVPPQGHDPVPDDRPAERRPAHAGRASSKRGRGRPSKRWVIHVKAIDPARYAQFMRYPGHPCAGMKPEDRLEDISAFCARLWARTCEGAARPQPAAAKTKGQLRRKAA